MTTTLTLAAESAADIARVARPPLQLRGLSLAYPGQAPVLDGLDWTLEAGQVVGLLGRNGAGKTTLLEALLGLRETQAGQALLFGQPVGGMDDAVRARTGYVPQQSDLFEDFTVEQLLRYFRSFYPRWNEAKVEALLSRWELPRGRQIGRLSQGQQQRLSIVRALAHEPDLLVLDEPVASLDPAGRRDFLRELVEQVLDRGTTVLFSTHILSDLERVAFNIAFLHGGRIALQAAQDELADELRLLIGPASLVRAAVAAHGGQVLRERSLDPEGGEAGLRVLARLAREPAQSAQLRVDALGLEDLFLELTQ
ncbi:ABC transporter ATP-binding protein [Pelomonas sp. CA6]|uniref:ABC transporter ATP-binding protein n=1 Tax=Pelomonas sp. CA6 TaxID=2907999 RepID=UPI001F4C407A|nr:ABC transporter ATP-binding protein [Pelomonas sp. CA6]MCH7345490.1 ABC transporter ATP-binding protein [Pelomonas sp. CA6]